MPILQIEGRKVEVDESFLSLSPEQQNIEVDEIAKSLKLEPSAPPQEEQGFLDHAVDFARDTAVNAMDMATLGWNKKAAAALGAVPALLPGGKSYGEEYDRLYRGQKALVDRAQENSLAKVTGETIGLAPAAILTAGAAPAATYTAQAAKGLPRLSQAVTQTAKGALAPAATVGGRIGQAARLGATSGGLGAMSDAEGSLNMVQEGVLGAAKGAAAGALVGGASEAVPSLVGAAKRLAGFARRAPVKERAAKRIANWASQDGHTPEAMVDRVRHARDVGADEFALLDSGSNNLHGLARSISNKPGRGGDLLSDVTTGRKAGQYDRNIRAIRKELGPIESPAALKQAARERSQMITEPLYRAGHGDAIEVDDDLSLVLSRPSVKKAVQQARRNYRETDRKPPSIYDEDGQVDEELTELPAEMLHYLREELDVAIELLEGSAKANRHRGNLIQTRKQLDHHIKSGSERMALADSRHAALKKDEAALNAGYNLPNNKPRDVEGMLKGAEASELDMFRSGSRARMADDLGKMRDGRNVSTSFLATPNQQEVLKSVAPNREKGSRFGDFLHAERAMTRSDAAISGNSTTAKQLAMQDADSNVTSEAVGGVIRGGARNWLRNRLADFVTSTGRMTDAERRVIAEILTDTSEEGLEEFLDYALQNAAEQLAKQRGQGPITALGGLGVGAVMGRE
ncbi:MAG: hypothetical protein N4A65_00335 [Cohaesibacter sp.]|jgi:hypothetical protein|nr:hypothetical protein [Cohaesibacter sp.]